MHTEEEILKGLKSGKEEAYKYLYDQHYNALCLYAYYFVNDHFTAETIVADIIFNVWQNREDLNINHSLRSYLTRAVKNQCINHHIRQVRFEKIKSDLKDVHDRNRSHYEEDYYYPLSRIIEEELDLKIQESLKKLPGFTRKIFELSRFSDMKYHEIADTAGVSVDVVKYHIKSALGKLREDLKKYLVIILLLIFS